MRRDYLAFNDRQKHLWWEISSSEGSQLNLNTDANDGGKKYQRYTHTYKASPENVKLRLLRKHLNGDELPSNFF